MKRTSAFFALICLLTLTAPAQTISYWFQNWQRKPDAQQAAAYFIVPGANVTFTYATNRVIINSTGGGPGGNLQLFGDVTSPLTALPNVTATLAAIGGGGVNTKITYNTKGLVTGSAAAQLTTDFPNQGTTTTVLHGNAAGNLSFGPVANADLANSSVTYNGLTVALGASGTLSLSGAGCDFPNEGTTTTVLHGNAAGNLSFGAVDLANDVSGNLAVTHLNSGTDADNTHYWRGDGVWATIPGSAAQTNIYATNLIGLLEGTNIVFTTNASGHLSINNGINTNLLTPLDYSTSVSNFTWGSSNYFKSGSVLNVWFSDDGWTNYAGKSARAGSTGSPSHNTAVGYSADAEGGSSGDGSAFGWFAAAANSGSAFGASAQGYTYGAAFGYNATAANHGVAVGYLSSGPNSSTSVGETAQSTAGGVAVGYHADGTVNGTSLGYSTIANNYGVAVGDWSDGHGIGNVAIAGTDDVGNVAKVPNTWTDTVELGRGTATLQGGLNFRGFGLLSKNNVLIGTNLMMTAPKWIDLNINYAFSVTGPTAPDLVSVTNPAAGSLIKQLAFDNNDELFGQCQLPHTIAITNAAFPAFYTEPHVHFDTIGTLDATHSNVTWRIEWEWGNINGGWVRGTNQATMGVTNNFTHYMLELGHITNNPPMDLSAVFRCRLTRPASATQEYDSTPNSHTVILDAFDLHVPIGNTNAIGSSLDNSP